MKKTLFSIVLLLLSSYNCNAQDCCRLIDDAIISRYAYNNSVWDKNTLNYYIEASSNHLTQQECINAITLSFNKWESITDYTFVRVYNSSNADITIKWATGNHGDCPPFYPDSIMAHTRTIYNSETGIKDSVKIHFNDYYNWDFDESGDNDIIHVALHEIGHALGLSESNVENAIMYPYYHSGRNFHSDDLQGIWNLYSCPFSITGDSMICISSTYSVDNLPSYLSVYWSTSPHLICSISRSSVFVIKNYSGIATLTGIIRDQYGNNAETLSRSILVGTPDLGMSIQFKTATGVNGCWASNMIGNTFTVESDLSRAYDRVEAQLYRLDNNFNPSTLVNSWSNISTTNASIPGYTAGWYLFKLRGVNDCGYSDWLEQEVEMVDFSMLSFLLDYDAASETLTLTLIEPDSQNAQGAEASSQSITRGKGIYIVRVVIDGKTYSKKFVKR